MADEAGAAKGGGSAAKAGTLALNLVLVLIIVFIVIQYRAGSRLPESDEPVARRTASVQATAAPPTAAPVTALVTAAAATVATAARVQGTVVALTVESGRYVVAVKVASADIVPLVVSEVEWKQCLVGASADSAARPICLLEK